MHIPKSPTVHIWHMRFPKLPNYVCYELCVTVGEKNVSVYYAMCHVYIGSTCTCALVRRVGTGWLLKSVFVSV